MKNGMGIWGQCCQVMLYCAVMYNRPHSALLKLRAGKPPGQDLGLVKL